jgi:DNA polymerase
MILFGDLETYCEKPIAHGTYAYAEACEIMLFFYAIDDGPVNCWDLTTGEDMPDDLAAALAEADEIVFQNSQFDRTVFRLATNSTPLMREVGGQIYRWRDTMVQALAHSLPGGLEKLGDVLKVDQDKRKLDTGKQLIQLFCKPRPKNMKLRRATKETHPEEWAQFVDYGDHDVLAMRELYKKCPKWNYRGDELALWHLDQKVNDRGFCVDLDLANAAIEAVAREQKRLKSVTQEMTDGQVESATKRDKLLEYILMDYGVALPDLQKDTLERRIEDPDLPIELRDLLAIRLQASTASVAKYKAVVRGASSDGRLRGTLQFAGASRTGRWAGRTFQPQNLSRVPKYIKKLWEEAADDIKAGAVDLIYENPMEVLGSLVRGCIIAPPGKKLVVGDLANIEGRMAAWLAGEGWKLVKFQEYDDGTGPDLYKVAYAKAFGIHVDDVDDLMRQIGKVMELMLQYEGGVGAFLTGAATYRIDLDAMAKAALPTIPDAVLGEARGFYDWTIKQRRSTFGLPHEVFIACDALKRLWRGAHPGITNTWPALKAAAVEAISSPGEWVSVGRFWRNGDTVSVPIKTPFRRDGAWLKCRLPSGRLLCYPSPQVNDKGEISYMGVNQYTRKWQRIKTYGGKMFENITQAASRDVLADNMPMIDDSGYEIILSVHDELLTEVPDVEYFSVDGLTSLMSTVPDWAPGLPLASAGFEGPRYKKD